MNAERKDKSFFPLYLIYYAKKKIKVLAGSDVFYTFVFDKRKLHNSTIYPYL